MAYGSDSGSETKSANNHVGETKRRWYRQLVSVPAKSQQEEEHVVRVVAGTDLGWRDAPSFDNSVQVSLPLRFLVDLMHWCCAAEP